MLALAKAALISLKTLVPTALAIDNMAAATSDGFILLDEISQARGQDVSSVAYSLFNGVGKLQGAKQGGNRERLEWRVLLLSTGEISCIPIYEASRL